MGIVNKYKLSTCQAALAACAVLGGVFLSPVTVKAEDTDNRLSRIEREIDTLNRAVYKGQTPPAATGAPAATGSAYQADVEVRLSGIENQLRDLTGKLEQQSYENTQLKKQLERMQSDMDVRLNSLNTVSQGGTYQTGGFPSGSEGNPAPTQSGTLAASDMGGPVLTSADPAPQATAPQATAQEITDYDQAAPADSPTQKNLGTLMEAPGGASIQPSAGHDPAGQYEMAFSLMKSGNYQASRNGFSQFLKDYPDHPLAGNATYWIGEDYYAEGQYDQAARTFAESYKKYPKGPKGPDSLLKMGMALGKTGKTQQSCVTLKELKKQYPSGSPEVLRLADQELAKMGCGG